MIRWWAVIFLVIVPVTTIAGVYLRILSKRKSRDLFLADFLRTFDTAWIARHEHGGTFKIGERVYAISASPNPLFSASFDLRLSTFCDTVLDFEIREAEHFPRKQPAAFKDDPLFRKCGMDAPSIDEPLEYLKQVRETLATLFPRRWRAFSKMHCEVVLSGNRFASVERSDLEALAKLAEVPAKRRPRNGTWTIREGFEPKIHAWHWKPEQRARLPEGTRRWLISCWSDNAYLNAPLVDVLMKLSGTTGSAWLTSETDLAFLEHAFHKPAVVTDHVVELAVPAMAQAADQYLDGEFMGGLLVGDLEAIRTGFRGALRIQFHDRAIDLMPKLRFYARRIYDDEFSWFSGEYEIISSQLGENEVREALEEVAKDYQAVVKPIERPFSYRLLRDDRLDLSF